MVTWVMPKLVQIQIGLIVAPKNYKNQFSDIYKERIINYNKIKN